MAYRISYPRGQIISQPTNPAQLSARSAARPVARTFASTSTMAQKIRKERDTFGDLEVPAERYWGAQTQRSLMNFDIGECGRAGAARHGAAWRSAASPSLAYGPMYGLESAGRTP